MPLPTALAPTTLTSLVCLYSSSLFALSQIHGLLTNSLLVVGGLAKMDTVVEGDSDEFRLKLGVILEGKMTGGMTLEGRVDFEFGIVTLSEASTLNSNSAVYGGDPYCSGWVSAQNAPDEARQLFSAWKNSLAANPITVRYRLVSLDTLFPGSNQADACKAIAKRLGSETFCTTQVQDQTPEF